MSLTLGRTELSSVSARRFVGEHRTILVAMAAFTAFAVNFGAYRVFGDGELYFSFDQHVFRDLPGGTAYGFGTGLLNLPFYAVGKVLDGIGLHSPKGGSLTAPMITLASILFVLAAMATCGWLLASLGLRHRGLAVFVAVFGTPLWYYASFSPSYAHAADTVVLTAAFALLLRVWRQPDTRTLVVLGLLFGLSLSVRPANIGLTAGCLLVLAVYRRFRDIVIIGGAMAVSGGLLLAIPLALGLPLNERLDGTVIGSATDSFRGSYKGKIFGFQPETMVKMLLTLHRGLFVWTPLTVLGVAGLVVLIRRVGPDRGYYICLGAASLGLLVPHAALAFWDGGWSFSMRYLSGLFAVYAIGVATLLGAVEARRRVVVHALVAVTTVWSVFLGMNHTFGALSQRHNALRAVRVYVDGERAPGQFFEDAWNYSRLRHVIDRIR